MKDIARNFIKNNIILLSGHVLIYAQGLILMPILIKYVGVEVYGGNMLLFNLLGFVFGISTLGVGYKYKRFLPSAPDVDAKSSLFYPQLYFNLASILVISVLILVFGAFINKVFFKGEINFYIWLPVLYLFCFTLFSQAVDYFRYSSKMGYFNSAIVALPYLNILLIVIALKVFKHININFLIVTQIVALSLITIPLLSKIYSELKIKYFSLKTEELKADMSLGFPLILSYIVDFTLKSSDRYIIAIFLSITYVGFYNSAYALGSLIVFFSAVSGVILPPLLSKLLDNNQVLEAEKLVNYTIKIFLLISIPFIAGCCILSKPLLVIFANANVAENASLVTPIVALGTLFYGINSILSNVLFVKMKTKLIFQINLLTSVVNIVLNVIFIYIFKNILFAAIAIVFSYVISFSILNIKIKKLFNLTYDHIFNFKLIVAALIMGITLFYANSYNNGMIPQTLLMVLIGVVVYFAVLFILSAFSKKEISVLKSSIGAIYNS